MTPEIEPEMEYHVSVQCADICSLAEMARDGAAFRIFRKRCPAATDPEILQREEGGGEMVRPRVSRILVPTDFSESAQEVFGYAVTLAREWQATLILLHVVTLPPSVPEVAEFSDPRWGEERRKAAELSLQLLAREAERQGVSVTIFVTLGDPSQGILDVAAEEKVGLIVMATHGRTGLAHLLLGSVAEKVVRRASCPVLTLRSSLLTGRTGEALLQGERRGGVS